MPEAPARAGHDVDTLADLEAARRLGVGVRTDALLQIAEAAVASGVTDPEEGALRPPRWPTP